MEKRGSIVGSSPVGRLRGVVNEGVKWLERTFACLVTAQLFSGSLLHFFLPPKNEPSKGVNI